MNARQVPTTVIQRMDSALTLTVALHVLATEDTKEMVQVVEVNSKNKIQS